MTVTLHDSFIGTYPVSQVFGANPALYKPYQLAGHEGMDFGGGIDGAQAIAAVQGLVLHAGAEPAWSAYGNFVEIWDDVQHCAVLYGHLRDVSVKVGQRVLVGQLVGHCDNTGHSTGPHLHFGLCLTDAAGNRLNRGNGFGGWVNPGEGKGFAHWIITNPTSPAAPYVADVPIPPPPPVEPPPPKPDPTIQAKIDALTAALAATTATLEGSTKLIAAMKADWALVGHMVDAYK